MLFSSILECVTYSSRQAPWFNCDIETVKSPLQFVRGCRKNPSSP